MSQIILNFCSSQEEAIRIKILGKWHTWRTNLFYIFIPILYMFQQENQLY
jgi:hypothetical protein